MNRTDTRAEGFSGQRIFILPKDVLALSRKHQLLRGLHPTRAGHFPNATSHRMVREKAIDEAILILCTRGKGWYIDEKKQRMIVPTGGVLLIPPGIRHAYGSDENFPWTITWTHFRGRETMAYLALLSRQNGNRISVLKSCPEAQSALDHILIDYSAGFLFTNLLTAATKLRIALIHIFLTSRAISQKSTNAEYRIEEMVRWMNSHLHEPLSLEKMARNAGFSISHFIAIFRASMGASPLNYFLQLKLQRACHLLDTTTLPIKTIAGMTGFADSYYFSRFFQKKMGTSPRQYRKIEKI